MTTAIDFEAQRLHRLIDKERNRVLEGCDPHYVIRIHEAIERAKGSLDPKSLDPRDVARILHRQVSTELSILRKEYEIVKDDATGVVYGSHGIPKRTHEVALKILGLKTPPTDSHSGLPPRPTAVSAARPAPRATPTTDGGGPAGYGTAGGDGVVGDNRHTAATMVAQAPRAAPTAAQKTPSGSAAGGSGHEAAATVAARPAPRAVSGGGSAAALAAPQDAVVAESVTPSRLNIDEQEAYIEEGLIGLQAAGYIVPRDPERLKFLSEWVKPAAAPNVTRLMNNLDFLIHGGHITSDGAFHILLLVLESRRGDESIPHRFVQQYQEMVNDRELDHAKAYVALCRIYRSAPF